ncbi:MAG: M24 family metallopeptidase [Azospirillaceae bacterium]|nr:M24 family metallopeptidase [Azospirillaceae bacterium]
MTVPPVSASIPAGRRLAALIAAEEKAMALLDVIEARGLIAPGRTERAVEQDIYALAETEFGVAKHWHKRIVRAGANTTCVFSDNPLVLTIGADDTVFVDLGPVFEEWEADVGRTYALGDDPEKHRLVHDLERMFDVLARHFHDHPDITGAELYTHAQKLADAAGWVFGGAIAGHLVGEFPHARLPGDKEHYRVSPANPTRMRDLDALGQEKHWILEVHLVNHARTFGGFYERLLLPSVV